LGGWDFSGRVTAERGYVWGFWWFLANCRLEAQIFSHYRCGVK
jgi:hypothetical protein